MNIFNTWPLRLSQSSRNTGTYTIIVVSSPTINQLFHPLIWRLSFRSFCHLSLNCALIFTSQTSTFTLKVLSSCIRVYYFVFLRISFWLLIRHKLSLTSGIYRWHFFLSTFFWNVIPLLFTFQLLNNFLMQFILLTNFFYEIWITCYIFIRYHQNKTYMQVVFPIVTIS